MMRSVVLFAIVAAVLAGIAGPVGGTPATDAIAAPQLADEPGPNATAPGAMLAGVVDVQEAEVGGELAERSFGLRIARAESNSSRASVVAGEVGDLRERLTTLEQRRDRLEAAHENGSISEARYRAETAALVAQSRVLERQLGRTSTVAVALPAEALAERQIDVDEVERLRTGARNLSGPEVAAIARGVAGPTVGSELSSRGEGEAGPPVDLPESVGGPGDNEREDDGDAPTDGVDEDSPVPPVDRPGGPTNGTDRGQTGAPNGSDGPGSGPIDDDRPGEDDDGPDDQRGDGRER